MEKLNWGWITYRRTSTTLQDGSRYYIAKIKAEHDTYNFTMIELPFFTKNIRKALRWLCSEPRTREEILSFRNKTIIIKSKLNKPPYPLSPSLTVKWEGKN